MFRQVCVLGDAGQHVIRFPTIAFRCPRRVSPDRFRDECCMPCPAYCEFPAGHQSPATDAHKPIMVAAASQPSTNPSMPGLCPAVSVASPATQKPVHHGHTTSFPRGCARRGIVNGFRRFPSRFTFCQSPGGGNLRNHNDRGRLKMLSVVIIRVTRYAAKLRMRKCMTTILACRLAT